MNWRIESITRTDLAHFFPSGQKWRGSSSSPASLKRSEIGLTLVAKAKTLELLALGRFGLAPHLLPAGAIQPTDVGDQLLLSGGILLPPLVVGDIASVAQQNSCSNSCGH